MVRCVSSPSCKPQKEWLIAGRLLLIADHVDRLVSEIFGEVIRATLRGIFWGNDRRVVAH